MDAYLWQDASPAPFTPSTHTHERTQTLHRPGHRRPLDRRPPDHRRLALGVHARAALSPDKLKLYAYHKWIGITVLLLFVPRILWRITHRPPAPLPMPAWQHKVAEGTHHLLYLLMVLVPLSGWLMSSAKGFQTVYFGVLPLPDLVGKDKELGDLLKEAHEALNLALLVLVGLHVAGALKHHLIDKDATLRRMLPFGRTHGGAGAAPAQGRVEGCIVAVDVRMEQHPPIRCHPHRVVGDHHPQRLTRRGVRAAAPSPRGCDLVPLGHARQHEARQRHRRLDADAAVAEIPPLAREQPRRGCVVQVDVVVVGEHELDVPQRVLRPRPLADAQLAAQHRVQPVRGQRRGTWPSPSTNSKPWRPR
jgi:cytochrome b561